jgi:hypothetical protein
MAQSLWDKRRAFCDEIACVVRAAPFIPLPSGLVPNLLVRADTSPIHRVTMKTCFPKNRRFRKITSIHLLCVVVLSFAGTDFLCRNVAAQTAAGVSASAFHVGDRVQTTGSSAVFAAPPSAGRFASNQADNAPAFPKPPARA